MLATTANSVLSRDMNFSLLFSWLDKTLEHTPVAVSTDFYREVYCILGLPIDAVDVDQTVSLIDKCTVNRKRCFLTTPNLNFLVKSINSPSFRNSVLCSDLNVADGMPLVWLARLLGLPIKQRVAGATLAEKMRNRTTLKTRVFIFGGQSDIAARAEHCMNSDAGSGFIGVGHYNPGLGDVESMSAQEIIDTINQTKPDFILVALGAEKGQAWIMANSHRLDAPVISHLGAVINMLAGVIKRAPLLVQNVGMEWAWRIKEEPMLWRRYAHDGVVLLRLLFTVGIPVALLRTIQGQMNPTSGATRFNVKNIAYEQYRIHFHNNICGANSLLLRDMLTAMSQKPHDVSIDLQEVTDIDNPAIALLALYYGHQIKTNRRFSLLHPQESIVKILRRNKAGYLLTGNTLKRTDIDID